MLYSSALVVVSSLFSLIIVGQPAEFTVEGKPEGPKDKITSHFCASCGTTIYRTGEGFKGYVSVRCGTVDDEKFMDEGKPQVEFYEERRVGWLPDFGIGRVEGMGQHAKSVE